MFESISRKSDEVLKRDVMEGDRTHNQNRMTHRETLMSPKDPTPLISADETPARAVLAGVFF